MKSTGCTSTGSLVNSESIYVELVDHVVFRSIQRSHRLCLDFR
jgi:hypothetical protein